MLEASGIALAPEFMASGIPDNDPRYREVSYTTVIRLRNR
jgi:hypothetical protein